MSDTPLFNGHPPADRVEVIPVTLELLKVQFIHRWGHNATAQERMRPELDELIETALADAMAETCLNAGCQCPEGE